MNISPLLPPSPWLLKLPIKVKEPFTTYYYYERDEKHT